MRLFCPTALLLLIALTGLAQVPGQIVRGRILDAVSQRPLEGANVLVRQGQGAATNAAGQFALRLLPGRYNLRVSVLGYRNQTIPVTVADTEVVVDVEVRAESHTLTEVVVSGLSNREKVASTQVGLEKVDQKTAKLLPALFGEVDIMKVFQLKPGVKSAGEGTSGISVRGGGTDQNLFLLDGAPVYNPSHLFGFFSTFNIDAIKDAELYKACFPAEYSGRLSSVVNVNTLPARDTAFHFGAGIGLLASRLNVSGPIVKNKLAFRVAARRTYADLFTTLINRSNAGDTAVSPIPTYYFYDVNARLDYRVSDKTDVSATLYNGRDNFLINTTGFDTRFAWGNTTATVRLIHRFSNRASTKVNVILADYNYAINSTFDRFSFTIKSGIRDYGLQNQYLLLFPRHSLKVGWDALQSRFRISRLNITSSGAGEDLDRGEQLTAYEGGVYADDEFSVGQLKVNAGLRLSGFANGKTTYTGLEPRLSGRFLVTPDFSFKANYARMYQYRHLVVSSGASLPTDIWYPSTEKIKPEYSDQLSVGFSYRINDQFLLTNESYYKWLNQIVDYKPGAQLFVNSNLEEEFVFGKGQAYGNEIYLEKTNGRLRGWVGYTLSYTWRQFDAINGGQRFFPRYDRRHDLSVVASYNLTKRLQASVTWVYNTGNAVSLPGGRFALAGVAGTAEEPAQTGPYQIVSDYPARNNYRMPAYHRMDLSLVYQLRPRRGVADLTFSVYNAYNRLNPYLITLATQRNAEGTPTGFKAQTTTLFPLLPSVTYNLTF